MVVKRDPPLRIPTSQAPRATRRAPAARDQHRRRAEVVVRRPEREELFLTPAIPGARRRAPRARWGGEMRESTPSHLPPPFPFYSHTHATDADVGSPQSNPRR